MKQLQVNNMAIGLILVVITIVIIAVIVFFSVLPKKQQGATKKVLTSRPTAMIFDSRIGSLATVTDFKRTGEEEALITMDSGDVLGKEEQSMKYHSYELIPADVFQAIAGDDAPVYIYKPDLVKKDERTIKEMIEDVKKADKRTRAARKRTRIETADPRRQLREKAEELRDFVSAKKGEKDD